MQTSQVSKCCWREVSSSSVNKLSKTTCIDVEENTFGEKELPSVKVDRQEGEPEERRQYVKVVSIEDIGGLPDRGYEEDWSEKMDQGVVDPVRLILQSVNPKNRFDVAQLIAVVLRNERHALYASLVKGVEDKIVLLQYMAEHGLKYNQFMQENHPDKKIGTAEYKRLYAKLRQDHHRIKEVLMSRMTKIIEDHG